MGGAAHGGGWVGRDDLAGDQPGEEVPEGRQAQLGRGGGVLACLQLDPGGDEQRLDGDDRRHPLLVASGQEVGNRPPEGASGVGVANGDGEEF